MIYSDPMTDNQYYLYRVARRIVEMDTTSGRPCGPAMDYVANELRGLGFRVALQAVELRGVDQVNLVAALGPDRPGGVILSAHIDTVPHADQPGWSREPLAITLSDERLYGRGVADMKGFIAQCLAGCSQLDPAQLARPVILAMTADEEIGCLGAEHLVPELTSLLGREHLPSQVWIGEPTSWEIHQAHKGVVEWQVTVHGRGGHSSLPHLGVNAIAVAARLVEEVGRIQETLRAPVEELRTLFPQTPYTTLNIGLMSGGTASNMIAEACTFTVSYRPVPGAGTDPLAPYQDIRSRLDTLSKRDYAGGEHEARVTHSDPTVVPPMRSPADTPLARALGEALGTAPRGGAPFATDGGWFAQAGMEVIVCGPGDLSDAHQPDESLSIETFERGPEIVHSIIQKLCV